MFPFDVQLSNAEASRVGTDKGPPIGTFGVTADHRAFVRCKATANGCAQPYWGAQDSHKYKADDSEDCIEGVTITARAAGDQLLDVLDATAAHIEDFFEDGWAVLTVGSTIQMCRIASNTAAGTSVTLTLHEKLAIAVALGSQIQVFPSAYSAVERVLGGGDTKGVTVCVPINIVPASNYFWGQVAGQCYGIPSATFPRGSYEHRLIFSYDGSVTLMTDGANLIHQQAGYRFVNYVDDPTGALIFYMLQLR